jgi:hypothetical protein
MQTAPGIPEAVARTDKSAPRRGHPHYPDNTTINQLTLRRVAPRPANPPLVPERQSFQRRLGPGGIRTLTRILTGSCAAITPQAHAPKLTSLTVRFRVSALHLLKPSFVLEHLRQILRIENSTLPHPTLVCDIQPSPLGGKLLSSNISISFPLNPIQLILHSQTTTSLI